MTAERLKRKHRRILVCAENFYFEETPWHSDRASEFKLTPNREPSVRTPFGCRVVSLGQTLNLIGTW